MLKLRQSNKNLGRAEYEMLQTIEKWENGFSSEVCGITFEDYKKWLAHLDDFSKGKNLPQGWAAFTTYFLYDNDIPVGTCRIRQESCEGLKRVFGFGEVGYGISKAYCDKDYETVLIKEALKKCKEFGYDKITMFPFKDNQETINLLIKNGGKIVGEFKQEKLIIEMQV